jgi:hypothetical protein
MRCSHKTSNIEHIADLCKEKLECRGNIGFAHVPVGRVISCRALEILRLMT